MCLMLLVIVEMLFRLKQSLRLVDGVMCRGIHGYQVFAGPDVTQQVSHGVELNTIKTNLSHFCLNAFQDGLFITALAGDGHHLPEKRGHGWHIVIGQLPDLGKINRHGVRHCLSPGLQIAVVQGFFASWRA